MTKKLTSKIQWLSAEEMEKDRTFQLGKEIQKRLKESLNSLLSEEQNKNLAPFEKVLYKEVKKLNSLYGLAEMVDKHNWDNKVDKIKTELSYLQKYIEKPELVTGIKIKISDRTSAIEIKEKFLISEIFRAISQDEDFKKYLENSKDHFRKQGKPSLSKVKEYKRFAKEIDRFLKQEGIDFGSNNKKLKFIVSLVNLVRLEFNEVDFDYTNVREWLKP